MYFTARQIDDWFRHAPFGEAGVDDDFDRLGRIEVKPLGQSEGEIMTPPQVDAGGLGKDAQTSGWPIGPTIVVFGLLFGVGVLSFFVKRSPAGRWRLGGR